MALNITITKGNKMDTQNRTKKLTLTGLMTAAVAVATAALVIPVPNTGGYIHMGDSMIFLSVLVLGWKYGAFASGVGSAIADVVLGYAQWAPATLMIKTLMAVLMGLAIQKAMNSSRNTTVLAAITAISWLGFNYLTVMITKNEADVNPVMFFALIIPLILIAVAVVIRRRHHIAAPVSRILGITLAGFWMVFGYFVAGGLLYGNYIVSALSIPFNVLQFCVGFVIAEIIWAGLGKHVKRLQ